MKRVLAAAAVTAVTALAGLAGPAQADLTVCPGGATVVVAGVTVIDQRLDCVVVPTP